MPESTAVLTANNMLRDVLSVGGALSPVECAAIIQAHDTGPVQTGQVGVSGETRKSRKSTIRWLKDDPATKWLYARVTAIFQSVNEKYQFDLRGFADAIQLAHYELGDYYDWHMDIGKGQSSLRKISLSIQLSDPATYDGGDLEFFGMPEFQCPRGQGTAITFPTFLPHRVTPVTRGTRLSLVAWISGPPFR